MCGGIYKITNLKSGKVYIGQTNNFERRWNHHKTSLEMNNNNNRLLQEDYNKYGALAFEYSIIEYCNDKETRLQLEHKYILQYGGVGNNSLYNLQDIDNWNSDYQKQQIINYNKQRILSDKTIQKMQKNNSGSNNPMYNKRKYSDEFIQQLKYEYSICNNYMELSRKYNIDRHIIKRLLVYGRATDPNCKRWKQEQAKIRRNKEYGNH